MIVIFPPPPPFSLEKDFTFTALAIEMKNAEKTTNLKVIQSNIFRASNIRYLGWTSSKRNPLHVHIPRQQTFLVSWKVLAWRKKWLTFSSLIEIYTSWNIPFRLDPTAIFLSMFSFFYLFEKLIFLRLKITINFKWNYKRWLVFAKITVRSYNVAF